MNGFMSSNPSLQSLASPRPGDSRDAEFLLQNLNHGPGDQALDFEIEWAFCSTLDDAGAQGEGGQEIQASGEKRKPDALDDEPESKKNKGKSVWRKYGQKTLKGKDYTGMKMLRCYYRCNHPGCQVKKQVETSAWSNEAANITIHGVHNHPVEHVEPANPSDAPQAGILMAEPKPTPPLDQSFADLVVRSHPHFVVSDPHQEDCPIIFASSGFLKLTGYSLEEIVGRNCRFMQGKDTNPNAVRQLTKAIKANREIHMILLNYKKDGTPFWNLLHISPIIGMDGKLHSIVGSQLDVSGFVNPQSSGHPNNICGMNPAIKQ